MTFERDRVQMLRMSLAEEREHANLLAQALNDITLIEPATSTTSSATRPPCW